MNILALKTAILAITATAAAQKTPSRPAPSPPSKTPYELLPTYRPMSFEHIALVIGPDEHLYHEGGRVDDDDVTPLLDKLKQAHQGKDLPRVLIRCPHGARSKRLSRVMDQVKSAGALKISMSLLPNLPEGTPMPIHQVAPKVDKGQKEAAAKASVLVQFLVDEKGRPQGPRVVRSSDHRFDKGAIEAVLGWRFLPVEKNGKPVAVEVRQPMHFAPIQRRPGTKRGDDKKTEKKSDKKK